MGELTKKASLPSGAELVVERNGFYRDRARSLLVSAGLLLLVDVALAIAVGYKIIHPPPPQYFAATSSGRLINWHPLTDPAVSDDYVIQWSAQAVQDVFRLDFKHWRHQLQEASRYFTDGGWKAFNLALNNSNNLKTLLDLKMVSSVEVTGAPVIERAMVVDGRYAWKVNMNILVTYQNLNKSIPMPFGVTVVVLRVPVTKSADRIAINNFLPVPKGASGA